jgi:hypothetical protein
VRLPVILDADIGGEPDDAMALVIAARELPELTLVLTSDEMSGQRARFLSQDIDYPAFARWLQARLDPRPRPQAGRHRVVPVPA